MRASFKLGESVKLAYVEQSRDDAAMRTINVWQAISREAGESFELGIGHGQFSRAYVSRFGFTGTDQQRNVGTLSGGERNRVHLARMLKQGANVLLLDEPTNDLDVNTMRALEEALENFAGCAVVISHDRWFLDRSPRTSWRLKATARSVFRGEFQRIRSRPQKPAGDRGGSAASNFLSQIDAGVARPRLYAPKIEFRVGARLLRSIGEPMVRRLLQVICGVRCFERD